MSQQSMSQAERVAGDGKMQQPVSRAEMLRAWLQTQPVMFGRDWVEQLEKRKREEAEFHDSLRTAYPNGVFHPSPSSRYYQAADNEEPFVHAWIRRWAPAAVLLDFACGCGGLTIAAARAGAALGVGIDISEVSVRNAIAASATAGVASRACFLQRDCENTDLPPASFDAIICVGVLHHLDVRRAYPELHRLLAPGGRILCVEALAYNPFIRMYRRRTPHLRTAWEKEHILSLRELTLAREWFQVEQVRFFHLTAPLATFLPAGIMRRTGITIGHAIDHIVTRIPLLRLWSWQFSFELVKKPYLGRAPYLRRDCALVDQ
jgi:SAM-dependent methyltransferase